MVEWEIVAYVHNQVLASSKYIIQAIGFVALTCDEVFTLNNQS
jgi:hypothetical protein